MPLWSKDSHQVDHAIVRFCAGDDARLDPILIPFDIEASRAHVGGLVGAGLLSAEEGTQLDDALGGLDPVGLMNDDDEDGHSAIERALIEACGDLGKKVHTGRSRNDQVLVATRLYARARADEIASCVARAAEVCLSRAEETKDLVMPGFTHLQRAVPSTAGFWFAGHAESLIEDLDAVEHARDLVDRNPLGTAAGYGVNLALDREKTTSTLGFKETQLNGLAAQNSRGRFEAQVLGSILMPLGTLRRIAWDLSLFSTTEFSLVEIPTRFCTGSSIMPNKRNPDTVEILRARFSEVCGLHAQLLHATALPSAYQRDLQVTKGPLIDGLEKTLEALQLLPALFEELRFDEIACARAVDSGMLATDDAIDRAKRGVPFRDAYKLAAAAIEGLSEDELIARARASIAARVSPGGPGALELETLRTRLKTGRKKR